MNKQKKYIDHNIKLYNQNKKDINQGWWGWHALITRFRCVYCGKMLKGSDSLTSYVEADGLNSCENLTCWDCHKSLNKLIKNYGE